MSARIIFLTGASGVGKATLIDALMNSQVRHDYLFYKFDSIGIPSAEEMIKQHGSPSEWQRVQTHKWIKELVGKSLTKKIIFEGQTNIEYVQEGFEKCNFIDYKILLLDCQEIEMKRRLIKERGQPELANEDMSNWLMHLRKLAVAYGVEIIDTTKLSIEDTVTRFLKMI